MTMKTKGLIAVAAGTSAFSAAAALPAATSLLGTLPGGFFVLSISAAVFGGWHYVATAQGTTDNDHIKRIAAGTIATLFAGSIIMGIHASASLQTDAAATAAAIELTKQSETLYANQESTRMATLANLNVELRNTSKTKNPTEYAELQRQLDKLSTPTPRAEATPHAEATPQTAADAYRWVVAAAFEIVTPALLILAGFFRRESGVAQGMTEHDKGLDRVVQGMTYPVIPHVQPCPTLSYPTYNPVQPTEEGENSDLAIDMLQDRKIQRDEKGNVTISSIRKAGFSERQARDAICQAVEYGFLIKTGNGGATRYTYPATNLRIVK